MLQANLFSGIRRGIAFRESAMRSFSSSLSRGERAKVIVVGSGRMGKIRSSLMYANPKFELCGVVDVDFQGAAALAETYGVRNVDLTRRETNEHFFVSL